MVGRFTRVMLQFGLCVGWLVGLFWFHGVRPVAADGDPWEQAVSQVQDVLRRHPQFARNLAIYDQMTSQIDGQLAVVEQARPLLEAFDRLKNTQILLVGNGWDALVAGLDVAAPGAGTALKQFDEGLRDLLHLRAQMKEWRLAVDQLAKALQNFQNAPSPETLRVLDQRGVEAERALAEADESVVSYRDQIAEILQDVHTLQQGIENLGSLSGVSEIGAVIRQLNQGIDTLAQPLQNLEESLTDLHDQIQGDRHVLKEIHQIVVAAEHPNARGNASGELPMGTFLVGVFVVLFGVALIVWAVSFSGQKSRSASVALHGSGEKVFTANSSPGVEAAPEQVGVQQSPVVPSATLVAVSGPLAGRQWTVDRPDVLIGRGRDCVIQIPDIGISRRHARLRYAQGAWFLQDQGSKGGTFVNGELVQAIRLQDGDAIVMGHTTLVFRTRL